MLFCNPYPFHIFMKESKRTKQHTGKSTKRRSRSSQRKSKYWLLNPLNWPSWAVWTAIGCLLVGYILFFYIFFIGPSSFRWKGLYGDIKYPEGYEIHGIDISHYQGAINWEKVRNVELDDSPLRFIFIKATEGTDLMDDYFNENWYQARANGFLRGAYHFFSPKTPGKQQAQYFLRQVHLEDGDLPPVLDIETVGSLTPLQVKNEVLNWLNAVEVRYGVKPIIYTNYRFKLDYLNDDIFKSYPYWIAHYYVDKVEYKGKWNFWQHTDQGVIPGIKGKVDLNIYNGSMYDLFKMTIGSDTSNN